MEFEYYVMNYDFNKKIVEPYNIFRNINVSEWTEKAIRKYLRSPKKYKYVKQYENKMLNKEEIAVYGFEALCEEIRSIIKWQMWSRVEYECSMGEPFPKDFSTFKKFDCYQQCEKNIPIIVRECIYQYKHQKTN